MTVKKETRGRKRLPPEKKKPPQATLKINDFILPFVKELKGNLKKGLITEQTLDRLFDILRTGQKQSNHSEEISVLKDKIKKLDELLLKRVMERDLAHSKSVDLESKVHYWKAKYDDLKRNYDDLLHREYDCMAMTSDGKRCTKKAVFDTFQNGLLFHVCSQHAKVLEKKRRNMTTN
jgi:hypothetical protein